jgi:hypothetical protein
MILELCKSDSLVHFQIFNVSALYLDQMAMILRHADHTTKIIYLRSDRKTEIFSLAIRSNG